MPSARRRMEMRDALTGELVTRIPLDERFIEAFRAALCRHPSRRYPWHVSQGLPERAI